ncbi:MAG: hypothetical protein HQ557_15470 [Bacteroidetes bacterium]|nr:hypothetical protein [Bacteroidota bacterium]
MKDNTISQIVRWLEDQVNKNSFADISINLKVHDGKIALIEKTVTEKTKLSTGYTGGHYDKNY